MGYNKERGEENQCLWVEMLATYLRLPVVWFYSQCAWRFSALPAPYFCPPLSSLSLLGHIIRITESSDVRDLLVARLPVDWIGLPTSSLLRTVRADLDIMDVSLEKAITVDITLWREKIHEVALRAIRSRGRSKLRKKTRRANRTTE